jgi:hypothetical protein
MTCREVQPRLAGYLDGTNRPGEHLRLRDHLRSCERCQNHLEQYRLLGSYLANLEAVAPPPGLALQIRVRASRERSAWDRMGDAWSRITLASQNILKPLAVPATGGVLTAVAVFVLVVQGLLVGMPVRTVAADDLPLNLVQPAELESLAPFPVPDIGGTDGRASSGLLLEATLNAQGEVLFYKILSGPSDPSVQRQIDQVLLFSRFRPQLGFGRPMGGGRVLLSFNEVHVRG